jgi:putative DNA primase/helicase
LEDRNDPGGKPAGRITAALDATIGSLDEHSQPEAVKLALENLARHVVGWDTMDYALVRDSAVKIIREKKLGGTRLVDAALERKATADNADAMSQIMRDVTPWGAPVDGAALLTEIADLVSAHLVLPDGAAEAFALWAVHTHAFGAAFVSPYLGALSPVKRCGKTTLLDILSGVVRRPLSVSNMTPATVFRSIEAWQPTLLMDEAETYVLGREELRGILNSGHTQTSAYVVRGQGDDFTPQPFSTWAPKFFALIGELPSTLEDRTICIRMRRKMRDEQVKKWKRGEKSEAMLSQLRSKMARWASDHHAALRDADPDTPAALHDRAADNWRPLLAIADAAGGAWPGWARAAACALSGQQEDEPQDHALLLLQDIRDIVRWHEDINISTEVLIDRLTSFEERPWAEWKYGRPMTGRDLAAMLRPFGIRSKKIRVSTSATRRGYYITGFRDVFDRYLRSEAEQLEHPEHPELFDIEDDLGPGGLDPE